MGAGIKSLEPYSGPYAVSTTDLELPVPPPLGRQFPLPTLKHSQGEPAFKLETVLFTLFYPADETRPGSGHCQPWVQRPIDVTAAGYSRFLGQREDLCRWMFKLAGESLQLPAEADRPLAPPPSPPPTCTAPSSSSSSVDRIRAEASERGAFPLIIFSHGMSGQRTTYSRWCGDMASHGFIVAALEHRDGSGPISIVRLDDKGLERTVDFLRFEQVEWPAEYGPVHQLDFRALQQQLRVSEVAAALDVLNRINDGEGAAVARENRRTDLGGKDVVGRYLPEWKGRIDLENVTMAGHSFGGGTTLEALRVGAPLFPFTAGIALDPSADPTPPRESHTVFTALRNDLSKARDGQGGDIDATSPRSGETDAAEKKAATSSASSSPARGDENANPTKQAGIAVPLLVINSESFTLWSERFEEIKTAVKSLKKGARGWLMTLVGSEHSSFSDVFLVVPLAAKLVGARASPFLIVDRTVQACLEFLSHRHDDGPILSQAVEDPRDEDGARPGEADKGWFGQTKGMAGEPGSMRMHLKR
ncbi:alpha/beta-hydrolase [Rhodotorula sp. JG-1b]|nr:alpha/beta-hydrolase [Rhodotorula sp. JG-1b]